MHTHTREFLESLTPRKAFEVLREGNKRFISNLKMNRNLLQLLNETANGQYPFAVVLSCMDSRTSVELIFDQGLGDIFSIRVAGNVVNEDILGSMEYACGVAGSKLIVVLGHTKCGAIKGACEQVEMGNLTGLLEKIRPAIEKTPSYKGDCSNPEYAEKVAHTNVEHSIEQIITKSEIIRDLFEKGKIGIVGGIYSVENGHVHFTNEMFMEKINEKAEALASVE
jgi:carbonic anhydrase